MLAKIRLIYDISKIHYDIFNLSIKTRAKLRTLVVFDGTPGQAGCDVQKGLGVLQVREGNHGGIAVVLVGFGLLYLLEAGFEFCQGLAGQGAGTDVGDKRVPYMRHGVVRGIEVVKPVLISDEVRRERVQQLEIVLNRNRHARPVRASRPILQCRKDELLAEPFQQPADDVAVISKYIFDIFSQSCFDTSAIAFATHLS